MSKRAAPEETPEEPTMFDVPVHRVLETPMGTLASFLKSHPEQRAFRASGSTFEPEHDSKRLGRQMRDVLTFLLDRRGGAFYTLAELRECLKYPEASISARIRDCKKRKYGAHPIEKRRRGDPRAGLWEYRMASAASALPSRPD